MSDKRTVATDALETLGTIIGEGAGRDAIHLAVEPVVAGEKLFPGMDIGLVDGKAFQTGSPVGIVDPFLKSPVRAGEKFWLIVYPRQITSLRHVWSHPAFAEAVAPEPTEEEKIKAQAVAERLTGASEQWIREFCRTSDAPDFDLLMKAIKSKDGHASTSGDDDYDGYSVSINDSYISVGGRDASGSIPSEFWDHVEKITGKKWEKRPEYFSCSC